MTDQEYYTEIEKYLSIHPTHTRTQARQAVADAYDRSYTTVLQGDQRHRRALGTTPPVGRPRQDSLPPFSGSNPDDLMMAAFMQLERDVIKQQEAVVGLTEALQEAETILASLRDRRDAVHDSLLDLGVLKDGIPT